MGVGVGGTGVFVGAGVFVGVGTGVLVGGTFVGAVVGVGVAAAPQAARISTVIPTKPTTQTRVLGFMRHLSLQKLVAAAYPFHG